MLLKKSFCLILLLYFSISGLLAQTARSSTPAMSGTMEDALANDVKYRYPAFQRGIVSFRDGSGGMGMLNYNLLLREIHFINEKGDTMALDQLPLIKYLTIGEDSFFFDKGVLRIIGSYDKVKLAVKEVLKEVDRQKIGAYGMSSSTGSIDTYHSIRANQGTYRLSPAEKILFVKEKSYFLRVKETQLMPVNWSTIARAFPAKKNDIAAFAADNHIDLNKEEDLKKLLTFCSSN